MPAAAAALSWPASRLEVLAWLDSAQQANSDVDASARAQWLHSVMLRELRAGQFVRIALAAGAARSSGALRAGTMQRLPSGLHYPGPVARPDEQLALLRADLDLALPGPFALGVQSELLGSEAQLQAAVLSAHVARLDLWAGRRFQSLGSSVSEGLVLNGMQLDGGGIALRDGLQVPLLGRVHPELTVARMARSGTVRHPWFHSARVTIAPTRSLAIGLNRAAMFGGENHIGITPWRVLLMLLGRPDYPGKDSDFENQVASLDFLWRTRLGGVPIGLHGEWAADDAGSALLRVPGIITGVEIAEVPALPSLALGVEVVHIAERCCTYPPWYQHGGLADGWTDRGRLLGHPLGGAGDELAALWRVETARVPVLAGGRVYLRERAAENLLAPQRAGRSAGARMELLLPWRRSQLQLRTDAEFGSGWQTTSITLLGQLVFE